MTHPVAAALLFSLPVKKKRVLFPHPFKGRAPFFSLPFKGRAGVGMGFCVRRREKTHPHPTLPLRGRVFG